MSGRQLPIILALGTTQTLAWASSYYLPAILADPIAHELGISTNWFFAAFSGALIISGLLGPRVGRQIDVVGGRQVLSISNVVLAIGLVLLGSAHSVVVLAAAWLMLGAGMGLGLYDAAFGALGRIFGDKARRAITGITLLAGFASTVGWPLTTWGLDTVGWRNTCFAWAAAHILIGLPLNLFFLPQVERAQAVAAAAIKPRIAIDRTMILLSFAFAAAWTVTGAMAAHLLRILHANGATDLQALAAGALIGPAQVFARVYGSWIPRPASSNCNRASRLPDPSARRCDHGRRRWRSVKRVRGFSWYRQRHSDDRTRHTAARDLRTGELWLSARHYRRTRAGRTGDGAARIQPADRSSRRARADRFLDAQPARVARARSRASPGQKLATEFSASA